MSSRAIRRTAAFAAAGGGAVMFVTTPLDRPQHAPQADARRPTAVPSFEAPADAEAPHRPKVPTRPTPSAAA